MFMSKTEIKLWTVYIAILFIILFLVSIFTGCDNGWSIMDWEVK